MDLWEVEGLVPSDIIGLYGERWNWPMVVAPICIACMCLQQQQHEPTGRILYLWGSCKEVLVKCTLPARLYSGCNYSNQTWGKETPPPSTLLRVTTSVSRFSFKTLNACIIHFINNIVMAAHSHKISPLSILEWTVGWIWVCVWGVWLYTRVVWRSSITLPLAPSIAPISPACDWAETCPSPGLHPARPGASKPASLLGVWGSCGLLVGR